MSQVGLEEKKSFLPSVRGLGAEAIALEGSSAGGSAELCPHRAGGRRRQTASSTPARSEAASTGQCSAMSVAQAQFGDHHPSIQAPAHPGSNLISDLVRV